MTSPPPSPSLNGSSGSLESAGWTKLGQWLFDAEASGVHEIQEFARKLRQGEEAAREACTLPVSNGQTEGKTRS